MLCKLVRNKGMKESGQKDAGIINREERFRGPYVAGFLLLVQLLFTTKSKDTLNYIYTCTGCNVKSQYFGLRVGNFIPIQLHYFNSKNSRSPTDLEREKKLLLVK